MRPGHQHRDEIRGDFTFGNEHFENLVLEDGLQILELEWGRNSEHALAVKTAVRAENVAVGVNPQEIPKGLYGNHSAWHSILLWHIFLKKDLQ